MNTNSTERRPFRWVNIYGPLFFVAAIAAVAVRADFNRSQPGEIVASNRGYQDFHNAVYFPVRALITGVNPYSTAYESFHPDELGFPRFAPSSLLLHSPLGFLTLEAAEIAYLIVNVCLLIFVCWFSVRKTSYPFALGAVFMMAGLMIVCRPGLSNFLGLHMTLLLVVGTLLALEYSESSPTLSGLGLLLACCKPTYAIPLAVIMLCRRNLSAFAIGAFLCAAVNGGAIWLIASQNGGVETFVHEVQATYEPSIETPVGRPDVRQSRSRIDLYSVAARWFDVSNFEKLSFLLPLGILLVGAVFTLMEIDPDHRKGINSRTGLLAMLVMLTSVYHQPYDVLVLWIPLVAFYLGDAKLNDGFGSLSRFLLVTLMMIPMVNFVSTKYLLDRMGVYNGAGVMSAGPMDQFIHAWPWKVAVTLNGIALVLAMIIVVMAMLRNWDHQRVPV